VRAKSTGKPKKPRGISNTTTVSPRRIRAQSGPIHADLMAAATFRFSSLGWVTGEIVESVTYINVHNVLYINILYRDAWSNLQPRAVEITGYVTSDQRRRAAASGDMICAGSSRALPLEPASRAAIKESRSSSNMRMKLVMCSSSTKKLVHLVLMQPFFLNTWIRMRGIAH
jgi:hypothetical protein